MFESPEKTKDRLREHFYFIISWLVAFWSGFAFGFFLFGEFGGLKG